MIDVVIPIILVQDTNDSILQTQLSSDTIINIVEVVTPKNIGSISSPIQSVPDVLLVINIDQLDNETAVITGLKLRNSGHQVIMCTKNDYDDLIEVMRDIFSYMSGLSDKVSPFRTELIITNHALKLLGDISSIVKNFEEGELGSADG